MADSATTPNWDVRPLAAALDRINGIRGAGPTGSGISRVRLTHLKDLMDGTYPGRGGLRLFSSPGRTEIGGNHTDHQGGTVLCAAVDMDILALVRPLDAPVVSLASEGFGREDSVDLRQSGRQERESGHSASLIRGVAAWFSGHGYRTGGFEAFTTSRVPRGAGLSSSAAFEMLVAQIFNVLYNDGRIPPAERACAGQYAENVYFGKPCGLMDQMASALGGVTMIDFNDPDHPLAMPVDPAGTLDGIVPVVTDTGGSHAGLTREYASIPLEMGTVARVFCADRLSDVDSGAFYEMLPRLLGTLSDRALLRAMHYFDETERARAEAAALASGDTERFLRLVSESGRSSWTLLQNVSTGRQPDGQRLAIGLSLAARLVGDGGAVRVHGGGFAGTIQCFVPDARLPSYLSGMDAVFGQDTTTVLGFRPEGACEVVPL
ncbi:MAG: galactokinase [Clostridia bacterium]|nr:galactokinase [Clostridia bacterium]